MRDARSPIHRFLLHGPPDPVKKLINNPDDVALQAIEGLALAFQQYLRMVPGVQAVVRRDAPVSGKVAIVTGGGSGPPS